LPSSQIFYSYFKNLSELNKKESPRLEMATKILKMMGIKIYRNKDSIKILGNPRLSLNKNYKILLSMLVLVLILIFNNNGNPLSHLLISSKLSASRICFSDLFLF